MLPAFKRIDSVAELQKYRTTPEKFVSEMQSEISPVSKMIALATLKPVVLEWLDEHNYPASLDWETPFLAALDAVPDVDTMIDIMKDPDKYKTQWLQEAKSPAGICLKPILLERLRCLLEPALSQAGVEWSDCLFALDLIDSPTEVKNLVKLFGDAFAEWEKGSSDGGQQVWQKFDCSTLLSTSVLLSFDIAGGGAVSRYIPG